ncbi:MAG: hypothetical protein V1695_02820, partial [Candidatus Uhrbacteria bacterium]
MRRFINKYKKWLITPVLVCFVFVGLFSQVSSVSAYSFAPIQNDFSLPSTLGLIDPLDYMEISVEAAPVGLPVSDSPANVAQSLKDTKNNLIKKPLGIIVGGIMLDLLSFFLNRVAYDTATWIANTGSGESAFKETNLGDYMKNLGLDVAGDAVGALSEILNETTEMEFNICDPGDPFFRAAIQLGIRQKYQRPKPRCEFDNFT